MACEQRREPLLEFRRIKAGIQRSEIPSWQVTSTCVLALGLDSQGLFGCISD